ncbi:hypothetical protein [Streptomyces sp. NPDC088775]|uniref:hypothetical protein n=1 Tax=Streptomyces sp. NPDC088775 TaxID=3365896 RepID=UPI00382AE362
MQSADRFAPSVSRTDGEPPMTDAMVDAATADHVHRLLAEARLVESAFDAAPAPARPVMASATPAVPVPPPGYTLRTTHRTTADGGSEVVHEVVPLAVLVPEPVAATAAPASPPRDLPGWLTANRRRIKAVAYVSGVGVLASAAAMYGPAIGAGAAAAAAGLWAATLTALKFVAAVVVGGIVVGALIGGTKGGNKAPRTGTFEGTIQGTWRQD